MNNSYLREQGSTITHVSADRRWISLDQTIIYPGGGGQPADQAKLLINEEWYQVVEIRRDQEDGISYKLSIDHQVPAFFSHLSKRLVPNVAILSIAVGILVGFLLDVIATMINKSASSFFVVVYSSSVLPGMVPWFVILISELKFRRQSPEIMRSHPFKLPLYPYSNYFSIGLLIVILFFMFINPDTQVSVSIGVVFLLLVSCMYWVKKKRGTV